MSSTQIPIYRAKKIDSDEYVEGYYFYENIEVVKHDFKDVYQKADNHFIHFGNGYTEEIDPSTLAIHFPDMIDSEGTKIFASLSEYGKGGKGGDILNKTGIGFHKDIDESGTAINMRGNCYIKYSEDKELLSLQVFHSSEKVISSLKVTGLQQ